MLAKKPRSAPQPGRIEAFEITNYRALRHVELREITPLTVLLGPNGSGKSTVFDVFHFLSECFSIGLRQAWDKRGRFRDLRSRGQDGPISFRIQYREPGSPLPAPPPTGASCSSSRTLPSPILSPLASPRTAR